MSDCYSLKNLESTFEAHAEMYDNDRKEVRGELPQSKEDMIEYLNVPRALYVICKEIRETQNALQEHRRNEYPFS